MPSEHATVLERFERSLSDHDVPITRTDPGGVEAALRSIAGEPAIGTPLPFEDVSLPPFVEADPSPADLESAHTGVTAADFAIADYGSVVLPSTPEGSEQVSLFPELHVPVLSAQAIVADMPTAINRLGPRLRDGDSVVLATGPSATADMGELVRGAHGPKDVHVVVLTDETSQQSVAEEGKRQDVAEEGCQQGVAASDTTAGGGVTDG